MGFIRISDVNGLCINNPLNARQNNYAWSISELGDYIYVGTKRKAFEVCESHIYSSDFHKVCNIKRIVVYWEEN